MEEKKTIKRSTRVGRITLLLLAIIAVFAAFVATCLGLLKEIEFKTSDNGIEFYIEKPGENIQIAGEFISNSEPISKEFNYIYNLLGTGRVNIKFEMLNNNPNYHVVVKSITWSKFANDRCVFIIGAMFIFSFILIVVLICMIGRELKALKALKA